MELVFKSVCLSANVFSGGTCWCLLGLSSRVFFQCLSSELNRCQICFSANIFSGKVLLMSAWSFPPLVCQCLSSGSLGFLLRRASLLPSVSQQSYLSGCFLCFWWSWYPIFFSLWRVPTGCLPLGLPRFCFKTYQIFFWSSLTLFFIKTVQVQQLVSKDTDRSWVGFKDSTGKHKLILTNYLK